VSAGPGDPPHAAAGLYAQALSLSVVRLEGMPVKRRLLLACRRRAELSSAASALVAMIEAEAPLQHHPGGRDAGVGDEATAT
jgi:hypothetical protein